MVDSKGCAVSEVLELVFQLEKASELSSKGRAISRICDLFDSDQKVVSWKFNEWDYGRKNVELPCYARGLFISDDSSNPEIVARGYDKFFSIDEVSTTKWSSIEENCQGPFEVTLKTNGCIILISGLQDGTLVVCSKHSTGPRDDTDRNHAEAGGNKLKNQLGKLGIDVKDFAKDLYSRNVTLVAEYCDDSFEEHILGYNGTDAGLYLHGINKNTIKFGSESMNKVNEFALKHGFKVTDYFVENNLDSLKEFLDNASKTGSYNGKSVEGFVIRAHLKKDGSNFFFKYKFEEPYLMYRQLREVTKDYITSKTRVFNFKKHRFITNKYLDYVIPLLDADESLGQKFLNGFGIIELRDKFLKSINMSYMDVLELEKEQELKLKKTWDRVDENTKFIIIPVATIGCGKTTTSLTLNNLYPETWGHVQNDDITGKDKALLIKKSLELLSDQKKKCVVVDRNNHQFREREQLFHWIQEHKEEYLSFDTNIKVIGLSFLTRDTIDKASSLTIDRVLSRADNHQSIKAKTFGEQKVLGIMNGFLKRYQPMNSKKFPDNQFDLIIDLQVNDVNSSFENAKTILNKLHECYKILIPEVPSDSAIKDAFQRSLKYETTITKIVGGKSNRSNSQKNITAKTDKTQSAKIKPVYFAAAIEDTERFLTKLHNLIEKSITDKDEKQKLQKLLFGPDEMIQESFHITMCHVASSKNSSENKQQWSNYCNHYMPIIKNHIKVNRGETLNQIVTDEEVLFTIEKLCYDDKIITAMVKLNTRISDSNDGKSAASLKCTNKVPHITLALLQASTRPIYSNELCQQVLGGNVSANTKVWDMVSHEQFNSKVVINF